MGFTPEDVDGALQQAADAHPADLGDRLRDVERLVFDVCREGAYDRRLLARSAASVQSLLRLMEQRDEEKAAAKLEVLADQLEWAHTAARVHQARAERPAEPVRPGRVTLREDILAFIRDAGRAVRPAEIATALGANLSAVSRELTKLQEAGCIVAVEQPGGDGRGRWYAAAEVVAAR